VTWLANTIEAMGEDRDTSSELVSLFTPHTEGESLGDVYHRTMRSAIDIIFKLGVLDESLNALSDVIESASGEQGLWAALVAWQENRSDVSA